MSQWRFLLDENVDPKAETYLSKADVYAEHVCDALWPGAEDEADVLPYARNENLIVVTSDVTDFGALPVDAHSGLVLLHDDTMQAYSVASGLLTMIEAYPSRSEFEGKEVLDDWV